MTFPVADPALDTAAGTYVLRWRDDESARAALLFYAHIVRRSDPPRGQVLLNLAREAGGLSVPVVDTDDLVDFV